MSKISDKTVETKPIYLHVRRLDNREIVKSIDVTKLIGRTQQGEPAVDVCLRGLLRNMDRENFFVDDSEVPNE